MQVAHKSDDQLDINLDADKKTFDIEKRTARIAPNWITISKVLVNSVSVLFIRESARIMWPVKIQAEIP